MISKSNKSSKKQPARSRGCKNGVKCSAQVHVLSCAFTLANPMIFVSAPGLLDLIGVSFRAGPRLDNKVTSHRHEEGRALKVESTNIMSVLYQTRESKMCLIFLYPSLCCGLCRAHFNAAASPNKSGLRLCNTSLLSIYEEIN